MIFLFLISFLCAGDTLSSASEYITWVSNKTNGLVVEKEVGGYKYSLQYLPPQFRALKAIYPNEPTREAVDDFVLNTDSFDFFILKISSVDLQDVLKKDIKTTDEYYGILEYFSSFMQKDIVLKNGGEYINCSMFHYERDYNISPFQTFTLVFPKTIGKNGIPTDKNLLFKSTLPKLPPTDLTISGNAISRIPILYLEK